MKYKRASKIWLDAAFLFLMGMVLSMGGKAAWAASVDELIRDSVEVLRGMTKAEDVESMADVIAGAQAVAFVPSLVKAGFVVGGTYGEGLILRREGGKWYGPSFYNLGGGSLGLQLGAQKVSLVLVVKNKKGVEAFLGSKVKLGGDIAVAAGPVGRRAEAATDAQIKASIYSYSMSKGLFAGFSLEGSVISISVKRNEEYWKKKISASDALKQRAQDKRIQPLLQELDALAARAKK
ncbi:MAG: lipid-binding SYLF domain-containing protein [Fretibacterium sp.]|nr:lipid-binding SYLF domain-containing protein [Fretibacterium sp.]